MKEKFIYEEKESGNSQLEAAFRKRINNWADGVPHHPYKNLGDKIKVNAIYYKPAYPIRVRSQYEERGRHEGHEPYTGQNIPSRTLFKLSDFSSWDIGLPEVKQFTDNTTNYIVSGSQHVENCHQCGALGYITCSRCNGAKIVRCTSCAGVGHVSCTSCGGSGSKSCNSCGGRGSKSRQISRSEQVWVPQSGTSSGGYYQTRTTYQTVNESCGSCGGRGRVSCGGCGGSGKVTCYTCNGRGKITCPMCSGSGRNTCPTCQGHKRLMHHFYVKRELSYTNQATCVIHGEVYDRFPQFLDEYESYESYNLLRINKPKLETGQLPEGNHLNKFVDEYLVKAHKAKTDIHTLQFQQLDVDRIDCWELHYSFKGKDYVMLFHGSTYEIVPGLSPIYEVSLNYWKSGVAAAKARMYTRARRILMKASSIGTYEIQDEVDAALEAVNGKISDSFRFGTSIATWLIAFFGSFVVYRYFSEVNLVLDYAAFINRPGSLLYDYHAWSQTFAFALTVFFLRKWIWSQFQRFGQAIPGVLLRIVASFTFTVLVAALVFGLLALLNYTGITILITLIGWMLTWAFKILVVVIVLAVKLAIWLGKMIWGILKWLVGLFT